MKRFAVRSIDSTKFTAVIDANVLFPVVVRDYLLWLAVYELYTPKWSEKLLEEFREVFARKGKSLESAARQIGYINKACPDALIQNYETIIPSITLPDENDRHVVAAAVKCNANVIVTRNLFDFPNDYLKTIGLVAIDPDNFIADMVDLSPQRCREAFREMVLSKNKPPRDELEYLKIMRNNNLEETAKELSKYL